MAYYLGTELPLELDFIISDLPEKFYKSVFDKLTIPTHDVVSISSMVEGTYI